MAGKTLETKSTDSSSYIHRLEIKRKRRKGMKVNLMDFIRFRKKRETSLQLYTQEFYENNKMAKPNNIKVRKSVHRQFKEKHLKNNQIAAGRSCCKVLNRFSN